LWISGGYQALLLFGVSGIIRLLPFVVKPGLRGAGAREKGHEANGEDEDAQDEQANARSHVTAVQQKTANSQDNNGSNQGSDSDLFVLVHVLISF
jgi:hypothetical protein